MFVGLIRIRPGPMEGGKGEHQFPLYQKIVKVFKVSSFYLDPQGRHMVSMLVLFISWSVILSNYDHLFSNTMLSTISNSNSVLTIYMNSWFPVIDE